MKTQQEHRAKLEEIADYAFIYGLRTMGWGTQLPHPSTWSEGTMKRFYANCNTGFKAAQNLLVEERQYYQMQWRATTELLKEYQIQKAKAEASVARHILLIIEQRLSVLAHIADAIAWQLLGGQIHYARRLHMREKDAKFLDVSNIAHVLREAAAINENPLDFALISDITSFIQIGDLLVRHIDSVIEVVELKEGSVNQTIAKFFDTAEKAGQNIADIDLSAQFDKNTVTQIQRMQRQKEKMARAVEVLNTDSGIDPATKSPITVSTPTSETEYYYEELIALCDKLETKYFSYGIVDDCLHVSMHRGNIGLALAPGIVKRVLEAKTKNYVLVDLLDIINQVSEPLFIKPLKQEFVLDVLTGKIKVIIGLDIDAMIGVFNKTGLKTFWMPKKTRALIKADGGSLSKTLFEINNRAIEMKFPDGRQNAIGGGTISKILYDTIKPSSVALSFLTGQRPSQSK
jgi:hypothetical protein